MVAQEQRAKADVEPCSKFRRRTEEVRRFVLFLTDQFVKDGAASPSMRVSLRNQAIALRIRQSFDRRARRFTSSYPPLAPLRALAPKSSSGAKSLVVRA